MPAVSLRSSSPVRVPLGFSSPTCCWAPLLLNSSSYSCWLLPNFLLLYYSPNSYPCPFCWVFFYFFLSWSTILDLYCTNAQKAAKPLQQRKFRLGSIWKGGLCIFSFKWRKVVRLFWDSRRGSFKLFSIQDLYFISSFPCDTYIKKKKIMTVLSL